MLSPTPLITTPVSCNTAGLTVAQFLEAGRKLAQERGVLQTLPLADGTVRKVIPREILYELRDRLGFGPLCTVNPFGAELWRLPRGYRFACGCESFADFTNLNNCLPSSSTYLFDPTGMAA